MIANKSDPMPLQVGSTTVKQAAAATAASMAFPLQFWSISSPAYEAKCYEEPTIPLQPITTLLYEKYYEL